MDPDVYATDDADASLLAALEGYDYFVIVQSDAAIQAFMQEHLGLEGNVGVYHVQETFHGAALSEPMPLTAAGSAM